MENKNIKKIPACLLFILTGALLYSISNPGFIFKQGFSPAAWIMYVPYLFLIKNSIYKNSWFYSGLYGVLSTGLYAFWLYNYSPLCLVITLVIAFAGMALFGLFMKALDYMFLKNQWLVQFLALCAFDYVRTLGFLGCHYGIAGYTQWNFNLLIQSADLAGIFGINAFVIFFSCVTFALLSKIQDKKRISHLMIMDHKHYEGATYVNYVSDAERSLRNTSLVLPVVCICLWCAVLAGMLVYGSLKTSKSQDYEYVTVAAIQHNDNPNEDGINNYSECVQNLIALTDEALEINPEIKIVIWPETAVVPSVIYNYNREDQNERSRLVKHLLSYIDSRTPCFVIGNQHIDVGTNGSKKDYYNSALVFVPGENVIPPEPLIYSKNHLVPFSEHFPYQKYFPHIYKTLLEYEKFFWTPSNEIKVFKEGGLSFYTPICFENTFPELSREAWKKGARALFCLANDSWSKSIACQYQHLAMAQFRAIESNIPVVVSSVSGQTAIINADGTISAMANPFSKTYVIGSIPVLPQDQKPTLYNKIGDILGYGAAFLLLAVLIIRIVVDIIVFIIYGRAHRNRKKEYHYFWLRDRI